MTKIKRIRMKKTMTINQGTMTKRIMTNMMTKSHMIKTIINQNIHHMENMKIETMTNIIKLVATISV